MNLLTAIFIILVIWRVLRGFKKGFAKEMNGLLSLFMALVVISIVLLLLGGILQKNARIIIISVVMLVIAGFLYRLLGMFMQSVETVAKLPVVNLLNMLAGAAAGVLEVLVIFWTIYIIVDNFPTGRFGEYVMEWTKRSTLLMNIYNRNYIANWITGLLSF
ncbi:MAG TPA: hypothetical protein DCZ40_12560 [Lachnospiraceae bacterium]|nr:hypothetical protein [Lachnospiraceae bacterium]